MTSSAGWVQGICSSRAIRSLVGNCRWSRVFRERAGGARAGDLDLGAGDRPLPARPAPGRHGLRDRRVGADHRAARAATRSTIARPTTWSWARRAPLLRAHHARDQADRRGLAVHRDEPRPDGAEHAGPLPATGSVAALISRATGVEPYFVGKPNPLMMRSALNAIEAHSESSAMIGDRMDTDIVSGLEAGMETILVLSGVTTAEMAERFPFRASQVVDSVADLLEQLGG